MCLEVALLLSGFFVEATQADVLITSMRNANFGTWDGVGNETKTDGVCVYQSGGNENYLVTATGDGSGGAFNVSDSSSGSTIPYQVKWRNSSNVWTWLTSGIPLATSSANTTAEDCGGAKNAKIRVKFTSSNLENAAPGDYSGDITITIEPN
jgi:hypothetical protein